MRLFLFLLASSFALPALAGASPGIITPSRQAGTVFEINSSGELVSANLQNNTLVVTTKNKDSYEILLLDPQSGNLMSSFKIARSAYGDSPVINVRPIITVRPDSGRPPEKPSEPASPPPPRVITPSGQ